MAWVSPTGHVADSGWSNETNVYDGNTDTYTSKLIAGYSWSPYLELTHAAINCDKVQFWIFYSAGGIDIISIDVYYEDDYHNIYEGAFADREWVEKAIPAGTKSVTAVRVKFYNSYYSSLTAYFYEFDFWEVEVTAPTVTTQAVSGIGTTTATGNGNITDNGGENCSKRGVCWNTTGNPTVADSKSEETDSFGTGAFTRPMTGLTPGQHYYVKAYAYNSAGYGYGSQVEFTAATTAYKDIATRFRLWVQAFKDIATRFKLWVQAYKDTSTRFRLWAQSYQDIATRFRLAVQNYKDAATRFQLVVTRDITTRFKLTVRAYQDIATRFILGLPYYKDVVARFKLTVQNYQDVSTRFFLYQPTWEEIEIQQAVTALEAEIEGLELEPRAHFRI